MKRIALAIVFCLTLLAWPVQAQDVPTLASLDLAIWPEYDQPGVLVIYRGQFAPGTTLPLPVEIAIPGRVDKPTAVAYVDEGGQRLNQAYTTRQDGDWVVVSFELKTLDFQLEYYDTLPIDEVGKRDFTYRYVADYPITALSLEFQVPPSANDVVLNPPTDAVAEQADGLAYHLVQAGSLNQSDERQWTFSYQKDNSDLTVGVSKPPAAAAPTTPPVSGTAGDSSVWIFLVAFVALVAVGASAFWLGRRTLPAPQTTTGSTMSQHRRGSGRGSSSQRISSPTSDALSVLFCFKCGTQLRADSEFCHKCGAPVRGSAD